MLRLEKTYGLRLAGGGLENFDDVTVSLVLLSRPPPKRKFLSRRRARFAPFPLRSCAKAWQSLRRPKWRPSTIRCCLSTRWRRDRAGKRRQSAQRPETGGGRAARCGRHGQAGEAGRRRGLANPFTDPPAAGSVCRRQQSASHGTFGCTVCHEGQGNATAFKWVSHTPDDSSADPEQSARWAREHGWFDNHHWIYPMFPKRFAEAAASSAITTLRSWSQAKSFPIPRAQARAWLSPGSQIWLLWLP